jgi:predicted metal-dependent phosphoesterase TrpH
MDDGATIVHRISSIVFWEAMRLDFHMHTTASDGRLSPTELVELANRRGLDVIAITDHDSTEGLAEARAAAARLGGPRIIAGVELNTDVPAGEVHVIGLFVDPEDPELQVKLDELRDGREARGRRMVENLAALGLPLDWERVRALAGGAVGRPHVAQAMVERGYVTDVQDAFRRYLGRDGPAYVERLRVTPSEAVALLRRARAVPVLAHPCYAPEPEALVASLVPAGLRGLEAYYGSSPPETVRQFADLAAKHGLIAGGGSDFHGIDPTRETPLGGSNVPASVLAELEEAHREVRGA